MGYHMVVGFTRGVVVLLAGAAGFVAFGIVGGYLLAAGGFQVAVAAGMGLVAAVTVHGVLAISEIPRLLTRPAREDQPA